MKFYIQKFYIAHVGVINVIHLEKNNDGDHIQVKTIQVL